MRKRKQYYFIETAQFLDDFSYCKSYFYYLNFRDFQRDLLEIIKNPSTFGRIKNASILPRGSMLYAEAHLQLSKAVLDGFSSATTSCCYGRG